MNSHSLSTFERGTASVGMLELADAVHKEFCDNYETWKKIILTPAQGNRLNFIHKN